DSITVNNWFSGDDYKVEEFVLDDNSVLSANQVDQLVNAMASFNAPAMGESELTGTAKEELQPIIAAYWKAA
ncbi:MAG: calcium-binding protein, partial [Pontibacterium sp.]